MNSGDNILLIMSVCNTLLEFEDVFSTLRQNTEDTNVRKTITKIEQGSSQGIKDYDYQENIVKWLEYSRSCKNVKCISVDVPTEVLPGAKLIDVKVQSRGPDDKIYNGNADIRSKIARGNTVLQIKTSEGVKHLFPIYALRKFTGGLGDEDDFDSDAFTWQKYFLQPISKAEKIVSLDKANGEAAHMGVRWIDGKFVLCIGSKNVHMLIRKKSDIEYYTDARYGYAQAIAKTFMEKLESLPVENQNLLLSFFHYTAFTAACEILNPETQHVEDLSYLTKPEIKFLAFTTFLVDEFQSKNSKSLCIVPPSHGFDIAQSLGLDPVTYKILNPNDVDPYMKNVRTSHGKEGVVMYFQDAEDHVIGMLKKKTAWYILVRAIREKVRTAVRDYDKNHDTDLKKRKQKITARVKDIQEWIGFSDDVTVAWKQLGANFLDYVMKEIKERRLDLLFLNNKFPVVWTRFLAETNNTDDIKIDYIKDTATVFG